MINFLAKKSIFVFYYGKLGVQDVPSVSFNMYLLYFFFLSTLSLFPCFILTFSFLTFDFFSSDFFVYFLIVHFLSNSPLLTSYLSYLISIYISFFLTLSLSSTFLVPGASLHSKSSWPRSAFSTVEATGLYRRHRQ